jgi:hypothetical protein
MDLPVAVGVQEDTVVRCIPAPMRAPDNVMVVPSCESGDLLVANRTETVLVFPQVQQLPAAFEGVCHLHAEAFFEVHFPLRVVRVCCAFDFDMPLNGHVTCTKERECVGLPLVTRACPHEGPLASVMRAKVFLRHPSARLFWMSPCGPGPPTPEDGCIHSDEGGFAYHVAVRVCPPANHGIELGNQLASRGLLVCLHDFPDVPEECFDILAGWFDQQFSSLLA